MKNTMTYAQALTNAIEVVDGETKERLEALKASLEKKAQAKSAKVDKARVEYDEKVFGVLTDVGVKPNDILKMDMDGFGSVPKITSALGRLVKDGRVDKYAEKGANLYKLA